MKPDQKFMWPEGQQCALSLTYDDALPVHYETIAPLLSSKKITGTFNICANSGFTENTASWKQVAARSYVCGGSGAAE